MRSGAPGIPFIPGLGAAAAAAAAAAAGGAGGGVVVVGVVGKHEEDLSLLLDRLLEHRLFAAASEFSRRESSASGGSFSDSKQLNWIRRRLRHYFDEDRGILYVQFSWASLPSQLLQDDDVSTLGLPALLEQYDSLGLRGLLLMFSVCHVILMVQDGARFDPKLLRVFRVLQAAKAATASFKPPFKAAGSPSRGYYTAGSPPSRVARQAPMLSLISALPHTLFPGHCTPLLLFIFLDEFSDHTEDSPLKISKASVALRQPLTPKPEPPSSRRKFQSALEAQVRFLIKKCRTVLGFGDAGPVRGAAGGTGGPALFSMDTARVALLVDRSSPVNALETTVGILESMVKGAPAEGGLWGPTAGMSEDILAVRDFIWRQAEVIRGRGGGTAMSVGVGMVAAAAAAAAASAGGTLRPMSNPPELPSLGSWLAACNMIAASVMKIDLKAADESEAVVRFDGPRRRSSGDFNASDLDGGVDMNMRFSVGWCKKVLPSARAVYLKGLTSCYPSAVHQRQLDKALSAFRSMVRGPAVSIFAEKLRGECESIWRSGRQQCDAVSLTGRPCMHQVHEITDEKTHCSGAVFLSCCACGRSRRLRDDPFDYEIANVSFYEFPSCEETLQSVVIPRGVTPGGSPWSLVRLGSGRSYQASAGVQQGGFWADQNHLSQYDIPLVYKAGASEEGGRAVYVSSGKANKKLFQGKAGEKLKAAEVKLNYNEESAFPPLPQKNDPKTKAATKKGSSVQVSKAEQPKEVAENGPVSLKSPFKGSGGGGFREGAEVGLFVGFEHECPRGHRFFLSLEHLQKLGPPYSQQAGVEKKHKRVRAKRIQNTERQFPALGKSTEKAQDGGVAGSLSEFTAAMENLSLGAAVGDGRVLSESDLPIFMECPHCKTYSAKDGEPNFAGSVSRLQRIFMVTPPFPLLMASRPVVQFDETSSPNAKSDLRFSFDCEVVLPADSFLSLRLPFVYCTENADGSLLPPLVYSDDHPEHTAWLVKGTAFYVVPAKQSG